MARRPETGSSSVWVQANEELGTFWEGFASLLESEEENKPVPNEDTP